MQITIKYAFPLLESNKARVNIRFFNHLIHIFIDMNNTDKIKSALKSLASTPLFVDKQASMQLLLRYNSVVDSGVLESEVLIKKHLEEMKELTAVSYYSASNVFKGKFKGDFNNLPKESIALIPVMGAMSRDSYCSFSEGYIVGTRDMEELIESLDSNDSIDSIVFYINTPGGSAFGNEALSNKIAACSKPTLALFEMMASAGVASFQGVDELYALESTSQWGSIGTYITMYDDKEFWKNMGIDIIEIYAPQSTEKNKSYREAVNGNHLPMEESLEKMTASFIERVKQARPSIKDDGLVFKGKIYNALEAKKIGAIDGIKDLNSVLKRAEILSKKSKRKNKANAAKNETETMSEEKTGFFDKFFGTKTTANEAEGKMKDLSEKLKASEGALSQKETELNALTQSNATTQEQLAAAKSENQKLAEEKTAFEEQVASSLKETEDAEGNPFKDVASLAADHKKVMAHNKELGAAPVAGTPIDNEQNTSHKQDDSLKKTRTYEDIEAEAREALKVAQEKK